MSGLMVHEKASAEVGQIWRHQRNQGFFGVARDGEVSYVRVVEVWPNGVVVWSTGACTTPKELQESSDWQRVSGEIAESRVEDGGR